jgi:hypothetical protein
VRWHSDFMSAPHTYVTDRPVLRHLRWWVNSGENFEPENTVPVPASGFVRRLAHTPHYDGGGKDRKEPTVICIFGQGQSSSNSSIRASRQCGSSRRLV